MPTRPLPWFVLIALIAAGGCGKDSDDSGKPKGDGVIETNLQPAPCKNDADCGPGVKCGANDFCDVKEMQADGGGAGASLGTPAPCKSDADCGDAKCVAHEGGSFCDVEEMTIGGAGPSLGAPAPCDSDADCGEAECVAHEGGAKFCDVAEMVAH